MKTDIEYPRDIIVAAIHKDTFFWYASEKEIWILDQKKWGKSFADRGYSVRDNDYADRFGISVITEDQVEKFLEHLSGDLVTPGHLHLLLERCDLNNNDAFSHLLPSLYVDFNSKKLISYYSEPMGFEKYVPEDWISRYHPFFDLIPVNQRYWFFEGRDLLEKG